MFNIISPFPLLAPRLSKLLLRLPALRLISAAVTEELFFAGLIGNVQIDSIIPYILKMESTDYNSQVVSGVWHGHTWCIQPLATIGLSRRNSGPVIVLSRQINPVLWINSLWPPLWILKFSLLPCCSFLQSNDPSATSQFLLAQRPWLLKSTSKIHTSGEQAYGYPLIQEWTLELCIVDCAFYCT